MLEFLPLESNVHTHLNSEESVSMPARTGSACGEWKIWISTRLLLGWPSPCVHMCQCSHCRLSAVSTKNFKNIWNFIAECNWPRGQIYTKMSQSQQKRDHCHVIFSALIFFSNESLQNLLFMIETSMYLSEIKFLCVNISWKCLCHKVQANQG